MKKQSLLLLLAVLAFGFTRVYGQTTCTTDAFHPAPGVEYDYSVVIPAPYVQDAGHYTWYITQNVNLLDNGSIIPESNSMFTLTPTGSYNIPYNPSGTNLVRPEIQVVWTSAAVASDDPFYLVIKFWGENPTAGCTAMNMKVWQINPVNSFLIEIESILADGTTFTNANSCPNPVVAANVDVTDPANPTVTYDYGLDTIYYKITAQGILGEWLSRLYLTAPFNATYLQAYTSVAWAYDIPNVATSGSWNEYNGDLAAGGEFVSVTHPAVSLNSSDEPITPIYIRIIIDNKHAEHLTAQTIECSINGSYGGTGLDEMPSIWGEGHDPNIPCDPYAWNTTSNTPDDPDTWLKKATWTINARPTVNPGTGTFVVQTP